MKVLVETKVSQGDRESDFSFTQKDEFVRFGSECGIDKNKIDGGCGCRRSFIGFNSLKATTTAKVIDMDITEKEYYNKYLASLTRSGVVDIFSKEDIKEDVKELLSIAKDFDVNVIVEKRGSVIQSRKPKNIKQLISNYKHLDLQELKEELKRCKTEHKQGNFMSDEISDIEAEITNRLHK